MDIPWLYQWLIAWATPIKFAANLLLLGLVLISSLYASNWASRLYTGWTASPFEIVGPIPTDRRPSKCAEADHTLTRVVKLTLVAPVANNQGTLQIRVLFGVRAGSRWLIDDVESIGGGRVRMDTPNRDYFVYDVKPTEQVSFLICGVTNTSTGGAFAHDVRVQFSDATWL